MTPMERLPRKAALNEAQGLRRAASRGVLERVSPASEILFGLPASSYSTQQVVAEPHDPERHKAEPDRAPQRVEWIAHCGVSRPNMLQKASRPSITNANVGSSSMASAMGSHPGKSTSARHGTSRAFQDAHPHNGVQQPRLPGGQSAPPDAVHVAFNAKATVGELHNAEVFLGFDDMLDH
jgi:hypothetical protein